MGELDNLLGQTTPHDPWAGDSKPIKPPACPFCGCTISAVEQTLRGELLIKRSIVSRYHRCGYTKLTAERRGDNPGCNRHYWSYTDPETHETITRPSSPAKYNADYKRKQEGKNE